MLLAPAVTAAVLSGCVAGEPSPPSPAPSELTMAVVAERAAHTSTTLVDGRVLVVGGCVTDGCAIATRETALVDAGGARAVAGPELREPRSSHTSTPLEGGRVLVVGGFLGEGEGVTATIEMFDADEGAMLRVGSLVQPRGGHAAAPLSDGRVLVVGGWISAGRYTDTVEIVDPVTREVAPAPPLPWAADALEATSLPGGGVLVTGGQVVRGSATARAAVFEEGTGQWRPVDSMTAPRLKHFAVLLDDGRVLLGGGTPDDRTLLSSTELYDPETGKFAPGPEMIEPRYKLPGGVVALPGSRVLIAGGGRTAEIVDFATGSSQLVAEFDGRSSFATVNLVAGDAALVLGGYDENIDLTGLDRLISIPAAP